MTTLQSIGARIFASLMLLVASTNAQPEPHPIDGLWKRETAHTVFLRHYYQGRFFVLSVEKKSWILTDYQTGYFSLSGDSVAETTKFVSPGWRLKLDSPLVTSKFLIVDDQMTLAESPDEEKKLWERVTKDPLKNIKNTEVKYSPDATALEGYWTSEIEPIDKNKFQEGKNRIKFFHRGWVLEVEIWNPRFALGGMMGAYQFDGKILNQKFFLTSRKVRHMDDEDKKVSIVLIGKDQFEQTASDGSKILWRRLPPPEK